MLFQKLIFIKKSQYIHDYMLFGGYIISSLSVIISCHSLSNTYIVGLGSLIFDLQVQQK